jgi:TIR domain
MTAVGTKPVIFISYAHADEPEKPLDGVQWLSFVTGFLKPAEKRGALEVWTDRLMPGGAEWNLEIERKLQKCDVFVLLVSRHSMASDFVLDKEIRFIRERQAKAEDVQFYPLLTPTPKIALDEVRDKNMRPLDAKPFSSYSLDDRLQHMSDAADEILKIAGEIADRKSAPSPQSAPASPPKPTPAQPPSSQPATTAAPPPAHSRLPPNPKMIGRKDRLDELVKAILTEDRPIVVPGALGMGKTTLALTAAHDPRVVERFGKDRRFFVNLEPAPNAEGVLARLATDLGLPASGAASEVEAKIAAACDAAPTLAILDNLETPWRKDTAATEALLGRLAAIEGLKLVITARGEPPKLPGPGARTLRDVERLQDADARALFLRHAGDQFDRDPALPGLLKALDGHRCRSSCLRPMRRAKPTCRVCVPIGASCERPLATASQARAPRSTCRSPRSTRRVPRIA